MAIELRCLKRVKNGQGIISEYHMCNSNGIIQVISAEKLKTMIRAGKVHCINLTLTKDDRLILKPDANVTKSKPEAKPKSAVSQTSVIKRATGKPLSDAEQLTQHLMRQKLMGVPQDAEYVVDKRGRVLLKTVFVQNGTYTIPSFVSDIYSRDVGCLPFIGCERLKVINNSRITNMRRLFAYSNVLELDLSEFDTSLVTNMAEMFISCCSLVEIRGKLNTSKVVNMKKMFDTCFVLKKVDLLCFDTSRVKDMSFMFFDCRAIVSFDGSRWDTSKVASMNSMFAGCAKLRNVNLQSFRIAPNTNTWYMFDKCRSLKTLLLSPDLEERRSKLGVSEFM